MLSTGNRLVAITRQTPNSSCPQKEVEDWFLCSNIIILLCRYAKCHWRIDTLYLKRKGTGSIYVCMKDLTDFHRFN